MREKRKVNENMMLQMSKELGLPYEKLSAKECLIWDPDFKRELRPTERQRLGTRIIINSPEFRSLQMKKAAIWRPFDRMMTGIDRMVSNIVLGAVVIGIAILIRACEGK